MPRPLLYTFTPSYHGALAAGDIGRGPHAGGLFRGDEPIADGHSVEIGAAVGDDGDPHPPHGGGGGRGGRAQAAPAACLPAPPPLRHAGAAELSSAGRAFSVHGVSL
eukprot:1185313-Prorocentrum_minimum.AAC.3